MDPGDELRLRETQREYLDFLDDEVIFKNKKERKLHYDFNLILIHFEL
jgi:hypothetical protein